MQGHRATRSSDSLVRRGSSFLSTLGIGDHPSLLGTRDPKGDGRRRLAASKGDAGDPVGALPAPSAGEQTPQIAQSCVSVRQWNCHGDRIYLEDTQSQTTLYGLRWKKVDSPPAGGTQIINRNLVRLPRHNPSTVTGEAEWRSLGLARPQIDSFVRSSAEDQTFYCPIPEDARETRFLCTINAPNQSRLKTLVELWDLGRHDTLRDELIQGRDFIVMPPEKWPDTYTYPVPDGTVGGSRQWTRSS